MVGSPGNPELDPSKVGPGEAYLANFNPCYPRVAMGRVEPRMAPRRRARGTSSSGSATSASTRMPRPGSPSTTALSPSETPGRRSRRRRGRAANRNRSVVPSRETRYNKSMSVQEIKAAVTQLAPEDVAELAAWLEEYQAQAWDEQIARDVRAGRFGSLVQRAREQLKAGRCRTL